MTNLSEYDRLMREYDWGKLPQKSQTMCEQLKFRVEFLYIHVDFVPQNYLRIVQNIGAFCPRMTGGPSRKVRSLPQNS
jgi:hypothetical protein